MVKTISKGIRIPSDLYNLVMIANKGRAFNDIVKDLLIERYSFISGARVCKQEVATPCAQPPTESPLRSVNAEQEVDEFLSCLQRKKQQEARKD